MDTCHDTAHTLLLALTMAQNALYLHHVILAAHPAYHTPPPHSVPATQAFLVFLWIPVNNLWLPDHLWFLTETAGAVVLPLCSRNSWGTLPTVTSPEGCCLHSLSPYLLLHPSLWTLPSPNIKAYVDLLVCFLSDSSFQLSWKSLFHCCIHSISTVTGT